MKKNSELQRWFRVMTGTLMLFVALTVGAGVFSITAHAESTGKVTAASAKIRKEPSTSSETLASAEKDAVVSIKGQIKGSDGYIWYQVDDANMTGYIRSDLISITDGSTPPTLENSSATTPSSSTPTTSTPDEQVVDVAAVEPVSGSVSSSSPVRVRQNASTTSRIVSTAQSGLSLTITGTAKGTDGKDWYQIKFTSGSSEISGFIRADYVTVNGELVAAGTATDTPEATAPPETDQPEPEETKDWDTYFADGKWHLADNTTNNVYDINQIFESVEANTQTLNDTIKSNKTQQVVIICLVILLILLAAVISYLVFRLKDMADTAYFNEVERETARRRTADRPADRYRRPSTTGGNGQRPSGQRPSGTGSGQRPVSQRPAGQRPAEAGSSQRPVSQRPAGQRPSEAGSSQRPVSQRPAGQRPAEAGSSQRPASQRPAGQRPAEAGSSQRPVSQHASETGGEGHKITEQRPAEAAAGNEREKTPVQPKEKTGWQPKNFADDDEFEFQFLDWDGEDQK